MTLGAALTEKENESFLRQMRQIGAKGDEGSIGLDRAYLLLDALDAERARMDMMVQAMEAVVATLEKECSTTFIREVLATARVALENIKEATKMTLKIGDTLRDNDSRTNGATVTVVEVGTTHAVCKRGPRRVSIALSRIFDDGKARRTGFTVMPAMLTKV